MLHGISRTRWISRGLCARQGARRRARGAERVNGVHALMPACLPALPCLPALARAGCECDNIAWLHFSGCSGCAIGTGIHAEDGYLA